MATTNSLSTCKTNSALQPPNQQNVHKTLKHTHRQKQTKHLNKIPFLIHQDTQFANDTSNVLPFERSLFLIALSFQ